MSVQFCPEADQDAARQLVADGATLLPPRSWNPYGTSRSALLSGTPVPFDCVSYEFSARANIIAHDRASKRIMVTAPSAWRDDLDPSLIAGHTLALDAEQCIRRLQSVLVRRAGIIAGHSRRADENNWVFLAARKDVAAWDGNISGG